MSFNQSGVNAQAIISTYNDVARNQTNDNRVITYNSHYGASQDILTKLNPVENASFKSDRHSSCLEGTRAGILENLMKWAEDPHSQSIFWLSGIAGTGKSTIAHSFCESLQNQNMLSASFFCSRESEDLRQVRRIVPTLAYIMAQSFKDYYDQIAAALRTDSTLASQGIKRQWEALFMHPLKHIVMTKGSWHVVLVIDALDECEDMDTVQNILSILGVIPAQLYSHIHIFISCRPEYYIQKEFERNSNKCLYKLHNVESETVGKDIQLYLNSALHHISQNDIAYLAKQAGGLFVYASTQVQYLRKAPGEVAMQSRLNELLHNKGNAKSIESLYSTLLRKSMEDMETQEKEDAKYFINIIVSLSDPLSQQALSELWKPCDVGPFGSVLNIPDSKEAPIHIFHASFSDYILDHNRCLTEFYCAPEEIHRVMALACMHFMSKNLRYNICNMQMDDHISYYPVEEISPALQYSCKHWIFHLTRCGNPGNEIMIGLEIFLTKSLFFWIEDMCILQSIEHAIPGLHSISKWLKINNNKGDKFLQAVIYEGRRLMQLVISLIKHYPLQLYHSGIAWVPRSSVLHKIQGIPRNVPRVLFGLQNSWDMCEVMIQSPDDIQCVAFSPDGTQVVSGSNKRAVYVWDVATSGQAQKFEGHFDRVQSVAFSSDGKQVASGSDDGTVCIWNLATGKQVQKLKGHSDGVQSVKFSQDGTQVVSGSYDKTVCIWNLASAMKVQKLEGHDYWVRSVAFSPDGTQVASGSDDKTVRIWNLATGKQIHKFEGHTDWVKSIAFSPDGQQVVSGSDDTTVHIWSLITCKQIEKLEGHSDWVQSVAFSPIGKYVVSGSADKTIRIWDSSNGQQIQKHEGHSGWVQSVAFSPDGKQVVSGSDDKTVRIWNLAAGTKQFQEIGGDSSVMELDTCLPYDKQSHSDCIQSVAFSPDGKQVASGSDDKTVRIWNISTGKLIKKLKGHSGSVQSVAFSSDGKQVVSGSTDQTVGVWNLTTDKQIKKLEGHHGGVQSVAFFPNGKQVASGSRDRTVRIWNLTTGKEILNLKGHSGWVKAVAISPDGKQVVSGSDDKTVCIWNLVTGGQIQKLKGHSDWVQSVSFSPDGKQVVSGSDDNTICVWDVATGKQISTTDHLSSKFNPISRFLQSGLIVFPESPALWLLPQYQDLQVIEQYNSTICFGCTSGAIVAVQMDTQSDPLSDIESDESQIESSVMIFGMKFQSLFRQIVTWANT